VERGELENRIGAIRVLAAGLRVRDQGVRVLETRGIVRKPFPVEFQVL
jgi:hypothetical protein